MSADEPPARNPTETAPLPELARSMELVRLHQAGDPDARNELLGRYRPRLLRIVRVQLGDRLRRRLDEEDVVQEALLVAAQKLDGFQLESHAGILHWLARIAEYVIRQKREHHAAAKRDPGREVLLRAAGTETEGALSVAAAGPSPSQEVLRAEFEALIDGYVQELEPPEYREVVVQRDYYEASWEEVRRALSRPSVAAAQELYRRAHKRLQERLRRHLER